MPADPNSLMDPTGLLIDARAATRRVCVASALAAIVLVALSSPSVASTCHKGCKDDVVACRRTECSGLRGAERRRCVEGCRTRSTCTAPGAAIRTGVWAVTECISDRSGPQEMSSVGQKLVVRRGNCDSVTIVEFRRPPAPDPDGVCRLFGSIRVGTLSVLAGVFQRSIVLPDASGVVFEVTDEFALFPALIPEVSALDKGIFFVRADGTGLRRLGDATHAPTFSTVGSISVNEVLFGISPDQKTIAFSDLGPGADGMLALQIFAMDLASGHRRQLTELTVRQTGPLPAVGYPTFIDNQTIIFEVLGDPTDPHGQVSYSVQTDGSDLHRLASPIVPILGANVVPRFDVTRGGTHVLSVTLEGTPLDPTPSDPSHYREIFAFDGEKVLQLTSFGYFDTHLPALGGRRAVFLSSADPVGTNAGRICQLFSVDLLAHRLRQLTRFEDPGRPLYGCAFAPGAACTLSSGVLVDPVTGTVVFTSNCDPFGTNPYGDQIFAMRPDGTGLRQLTSFRGMQERRDGTVLVELPGPASYSAPVP